VIWLRLKFVIWIRWWYGIYPWCWECQYARGLYVVVDVVDVVDVDVVVVVVVVAFEISMGHWRCIERERELVVKLF